MAYLPYRDPETLRAFLRIIDEFTYDHSERLGDAFEYLLSVLGSQGDAGQFRTPRHIIDFIVAVVDPKKDDVLLDPACGTAGFLISAYKHILEANTDSDGQSTLTPDDRGRLVDNLMGFDISPDMVRLSRANMYLHGFPSPQIHEYDTLTSEERWNEYADVILANPPFMSPKGGTRPHNRFSVQSRRSEVLFVNYMIEHLTADGRAGIIVPEGIIFQSQTGHTHLRKMLVEEYLVAVISLPAGVFNPYSGVKTSILILDRALARRTDSIAFFKVENDGFDLGAQRRPIDKNDLPQVQAEFQEYLGLLRAGNSLEEFGSTSDRVVRKEKIATDAEYNLSGERYKESTKRFSDFPLLPLGQVAEVIAGQSPPGSSYNDVGIGTPFYQGKVQFGQTFISEPTKWTTDPRRMAEKDDILMSVRAPVGPVNLATQRVCIGRGLAAIRAKNDRLLTRYAFYILLHLGPEITGNAGASFSSINKRQIESIEIPLPPLEVQRQVVAELEGYQRVLKGAQEVLENYRPHLAVDPEWPLARITSVADVHNGFGFPLAFQGNVDEEVPFLKVSDMNLPGNETHIVSWNNSISNEGLAELKAKAFPPGTVIFPKIGAAIATNKKRILTCNSTYDNNVMGIVPKADKILSRFLYAWLMGFELSNWASDSQPPSMRKTVVERHEIPVPSLAVQQSILEDLEIEQTLIESNRILIKRFQRKIQATISRVWESEVSDSLERVGDG